MNKKVPEFLFCTTVKKESSRRKYLSLNRKKHEIEKQSCLLVAKFLTQQNESYANSALKGGKVYKIKQKKPHRPL